MAEQHPFDRLARTLAEPRSRRGLLRTFGVGVAAAAAGSLLPRFGRATADNPCATGLTLCGTQCKNLQGDPQNCGSCGNALPPGGSCINGQAAQSDTPPLPPQPIVFAPNGPPAPPTSPQPYHPANGGDGGSTATSVGTSGGGSSPSSSAGVSGCVESACVTCVSGKPEPRCDGVTTCCVPGNNINDACVALQGLNAPGCPTCTQCVDGVCTPCDKLGLDCVSGTCQNGCPGRCMTSGGQNGQCVSCAQAGKCCNAAGQCVALPACAGCTAADANCNCVPCNQSVGNTCCDEATQTCVSDCGNCMSCAGGVCTACSALNPPQCCFTSAGGTGVCTATCPHGLTCVGGACICNAASCPSGCCITNGANATCQDGTSEAACGTGGGVCQTCPAGKCCDPATHSCTGTLCGATCCSSGCCQNGVCQPGTTAQACGTAGGTCTSCGTGQTCATSGQLAGQCVCASTGQPPVNGQCATCGPSNCSGCCDANGHCIAVAQMTNQMCGDGTGPGTGGVACMACGAGQACINGECTCDPPCGAGECCNVNVCVKPSGSRGDICFCCATDFSGNNFCIPAGGPNSNTCREQSDGTCCTQGFCTGSFTC